MKKLLIVPGLLALALSAQAPAPDNASDLVIISGVSKILAKHPDKDSAVTLSVLIRRLAVYNDAVTNLQQEVIRQRNRADVAEAATRTAEAKVKTCEATKTATPTTAPGKDNASARPN